VLIVLSICLGGFMFLGAGLGALGAMSAFVLPFVFIGLGHLQASRLGGRAGKPLIEQVDLVAATFPTRSLGAAPEHTPLPSTVAAIPPPPPGLGVMAGWMPDPTARHELRYWNGADWSEHVADSGRQQSDPL
jgi:hypothetical protein